MSTPTSPETVVKVHALAIAGMGNRDIAAIVGIAPSTVHRLRHQYGMPTNPKTVPTNQRPAVRPHGTQAAIQRHYYHHEPLCEPCRIERNRIRQEQRARRKQQKEDTP